MLFFPNYAPFFKIMPFEETTYKSKNYIFQLEGVGLRIQEKNATNPQWNSNKHVVVALPDER